MEGKNYLGLSFECSGFSSPIVAIASESMDLSRTYNFETASIGLLASEIFLYKVSLLITQKEVKCFFYVLKMLNGSDRDLIFPCSQIAPIPSSPSSPYLHEFTRDLRGNSPNSRKCDRCDIRAKQR